MTKLPKTLYVRMESNKDEFYPLASEDIAEAIEADGPTTIGVYELVERRVARKVIEHYKPRRQR